MRHLLLLMTICCANQLLIDKADGQERKREISWVNADVANVKGLTHHILKSEPLGHDVGYAVWTPPGFDKDRQTRYPVVYFLHGAGGSEASDSGGFSSMVARAIRENSFPEAICVFPNGGMSGYQNAVESMIVNELIPQIDQDYPTVVASSGRVVAGFSMGGAGSVHLALRHPKLFCGAGSWGGALSWRGDGADSPLLPMARSNADTLRSNGFALLTINGDGDRPAAFLPMQRTLKPLGIPHTVKTLAGTKHNLGHYYERAGDEMLSFLAQRLTQDARNNSQPDQAKRLRTVRVLTIGNSFAQNACKYVKGIAADGGVKLIVGGANLGGCTLERHARLARQFQSDNSTRAYSQTISGRTTKLSLQEYLAADAWDFVTIQQQSALSYQPDSYHPHIDELVAVIHEHAPGAKVLIHQTWAYRPDSPYYAERNLTQAEMHARLVTAYDDVAAQFNADLIPVGAAFHAVRSAADRQIIVPDPNYDFTNPKFPNLPDQNNSLVVGWSWADRETSPKLRLDFKHANAGGCYLAGLVWYETLTGNDAREIDFLPAGVDPIDATLFRSTAHQVVAER